jgi:MFS family permease
VWDGTVSAPGPAAALPAAAGPGRNTHRAAALAVVCAAQFVLLLDLTVVNVALPTVQSDLAIGPMELQWLITAYALTYGGFLLLAGRAADVFGRRRVFVGGMVVFGAASLAAGLAPGAGLLVAARAAQGLGGAAASAGALALVTTTFREGRERNRALGIFANVASAGGVSGLILGGVLTGWAGWRSVFLVNVPIAIAAAAVAPFVLSEARRTPARRRLDVVGALTSTLALLALVYGLARAGQAGFDDVLSVSALTGGVVLGAAFVLAERRAPDPLIPGRLLRLPTVLGTDMTALAVSPLIGATPFFLTLYMQRVLNLSPAITALAFLPMTLTITLTTTLATRRAEDVGLRRLLLLGVASLALGAVLLSRVSTAGSYPADVLPGMLLFAIGLAASYTGAGIGGTTGVADGDQGVAGGLLSTAKQVGSAVGLTVLAVVATGGAAASQTDGAVVGGLMTAFVTALCFPALAVLAATTLLSGRSTARPGRRQEPITPPCLAADCQGAA